MSGAMTTAIVGGVAAAAVMQALAPEAPKPPPPMAPTPAPQASKQPDQAAVRRQAGSTGYADGAGNPEVAGTPAGTLLTGPGGIDTKDLKLGKNVALGA